MQRNMHPPEDIIIWEENYWQPALATKLAECTLEGKWGMVVQMYEKYQEAHTEIVNDYMGTALHVAIEFGKEEVAKLVSAIIEHEENEGRSPSALLMRNERGDTALHVAASREFPRICKCIVGEDNERLHLVEEKNKEGETPLFVAAVTGSKAAFAYLYHISEGIVFPMRDLVRKNGDSILHCAIMGEIFGTPVEPLDAKRTIKKLLKATEPQSLKFSINYGKMFRNKHKKDPHDAEDPPIMRSEGGYLPTFQQFVRSRLPFDDIRETKEKHKWGRQLLDALMKDPYYAYTGLKIDFLTDDLGNLNSDGDNTMLPTGETLSPMLPPLTEAPLLLAARNGIFEMVIEILRKLPSTLHETNAKKQNVLLVAVLNKQPLVVETLKKEATPTAWNNLILAADQDENTVLHLAADAHGEERPRQIDRSALQMMWDIKWYEYIKSNVPKRLYLKNNKDNKTAEDIFKETHRDLIKDSNDWLKDTSQSCSVVAALVAGVSFATATTVPGGNGNNGQPPLKGQPAFDAFAISSLVGLCFSATGLIMFLTIMTSRKEARDFRRGLPVKLLLGLSSLFLSIVAMLVSFCSGHFFNVNHRYKDIFLSVYAATSLPLAFYAFVQLPLYIDLLTTIFGKLPWAKDKGDNL